MAHPLEGAMLKLARAGQHLNSLDAQVNAFLDQEPHPYVLKPDAWFQGDKHVTNVTVNVAKQPPRGLQPYQRGDAAKDHPLAILNALSNRDKHRLLPLTVAQVNDASAKIYGPDLTAVHSIRHYVGPVKDKAELVRIVYSTTKGVAKPDVHVEGNVTVDVALADGRPVRQTLLDVGLFVEAIVEFFTPVL